MSKKSRSKLGDVYSIPLPTGKFAFCRLFEESVVAVFEQISDNIFEIPLNHSYLFFVGVYKYVLIKTEWTKVGNVPFLNEEDKWPPPFSVYDIISRKHYLYHKGEMILATEKIQITSS